MNKLFTKIATAFVGIAMAIGVGVVVGSKSQTIKSDAAAASSSTTAPTDATWSYTLNNTDFPSISSGSDSGFTKTLNGISFTFSGDTHSSTNTYRGSGDRGIQFGKGTNGWGATTNMTLTAAVSSFGANRKITKTAIALSCASKGGYSGTLPNGDTTNGTATSVTYYTSSAMNLSSGNIVFTFASTSNAKAIYVKAIYVWHETALSTPEVTIGAKPTYLIEGGSAGSLVATISNNNNYTITWSASPSAGVSFSPATSSSGETVSVEFDGTTPGTTPIAITATLNDANTTASSPVNVYSLGHAGTADDPFSATDAMVFSHTSHLGQSGGDWYVQGYVVSSYVHAQSGETRGYYIDEDKTASTSKKFEVFNNTAASLNGTNKAIIVGTSYIVAHGSMTYYNTQCETSGSIITSVDNGAVPSVSINGGDQSVYLNSPLTLTATKENDNNATITWTSSDSSVATIGEHTGVVTTVGVGHTTINASITVDAVDYESEITLTVIQTIVSVGDVIYISAEYNSTNYYLSGFANNLGTCSTTESDAVTFTVCSGNSSGSFALKNSSNEYLYFTGDNAYLNTNSTLSDNTSWFIYTDGTSDFIYNVAVPARHIRYNDNGHSTDNSKVNRFAGYTTGQTAITVNFVAAPTEVTLNEHAATIENGKTLTLTYTADAAGTFAWISSNPAVATVENGVVECLASAGTATITVFFDKDGDGVKDENETVSDSCVITASAPTIDFSSANYGGIATLIETTTGLDGKKVVFGRNAVPAVSGSLSGSMLTAIDDESNVGGVSYNSTTKKMTIGNGRIETGVTVFTVNAVSGGYTFSTTINSETKYLRETSAKNVALGEAQTWTIEIEDGTAIITSTNQLQFNSSNPRFTTYASSQASIELYEFKSYYEEATEYAEYFVGGNSGTCAETITDWDDLSDMFDDLSVGAQNVYKIATHNPANTYNHEITVEHAVARYDDVLQKHSELRSKEFMGRVTEGTLVYGSQNVALTAIKSNLTTTIVVVVSMLSLISVSGFFLLRRRKEQ